MTQSFIHAALRPLRHYGAFHGRATRLEFWGFQLVINLAGGVMEGICQLAGLAGLSVVAWLAFLLPSLAVGARRLQDTGRSGWWLLAPWTAFTLLFALSLTLGSGVVPGPTANAVASMTIVFLLVLLAAALVLLFAWFSAAGTAGPNRFGPDPVAATDLAEIFG